jgi:CheY-like chemotaxis protein
MTLANNMFDILDQTKVELNRIVLNPCIINFKQLIKSVLDIISENIPYNIDDSVPKYIYNDPHRIKQILIILIKNSLQQSVNDVYLLASSIIVNDNLNNMSEYQHNIKITIKNNHKYDNTNIIFAPLIVNCDGDPNLRVSYLLAKLLNGYVELKETCFEFSFITPEDEPIEYSNKTLTKLRGKTAIIIGKLPTLIKILDLYEIKYIIVDSYEEYNILYLDSKPDIIIDTINPVTTILTDVDKKIYINKHMSDIEIKVAIRSVIKDNNDIYNKKIMVVEDEIINRIVIEKILKKIGYTNIILINNGIKALKAYDTSIDLLLIDIRMPGMSGFELSNAIHQINPSAKMIGITAQTVSETELKPWFKDFVYKPINTQDLKNKINHLLI